MKKNNFLNNFIRIFSNENKVLETIIFILFLCGVIFLSFFHEPWYDEFQAWAIAKDSLYNIIFVIPHMEGHPPLWHLILKLIQQFTDNPELVIKIPNIIFMSCAIWLLIFKSPFPRIVRLTLPFTYFLFYQYSILNRPYSLMALSLFLAAFLYKDKHIHPYRFISSLVLLCLSSAYGMLISTGITVSWVIEIWNKQNLIIFLKNFLKDRRFFAMLVLFFVCLLITCEINSVRIGFQTSFFDTPFYQRLLYYCSGISADVTIFNVLDYVTHDSYNIMGIYFILASCFGFYINFLLINIFKTLKKLSLFILLFVPFVMFGLFVYMSPHHLGILFLILVFCFWVSDISENSSILSPVYRKQLQMVLFLTFAIQIFWSGTSYINEIKNEYCISRTLAAYIKKHNLSQYNILSEWFYRIAYINKDGDVQLLYQPNGIFQYWKYPDYQKTIIEVLNSQSIPVFVNPYFNKNIFYNFNTLTPGKLYLSNINNNPMYNDTLKRIWKQLPPPDVIIIQYVTLNDIKPEEIWGAKSKIRGNYISIKSFNSVRVWKDKLNPLEYNVFILVHKNLYEKMKNYE